MSAISNIQEIPISQIRPHRVALRQVDRTSPGYHTLLGNIRREGFTTVIKVHGPLKDKDTGETYYTLIDGLHRYTAAKEIGLTALPAYVEGNANDGEILVSQFLANYTVIETKPVEYAEQVQRIVALNPHYTMSDLCKLLNTTPQVLQKRVSLLNIKNEEVKELVNAGQIPLLNAYALAGLPEQEQEHYKQDAITMSTSEFAPKIAARKKELAEARKQAREANPPVWEPTPTLRKLSELKAAITSPPSIILPDSPSEAFLLGIKWAIQLDPASVERQKMDEEARKAAAKERADKRNATAGLLKEEDVEVRIQKAELERLMLNAARAFEFDRKIAPQLRKGFSEAIAKDKKLKASEYFEAHRKDAFVEPSNGPDPSTH
jgi:ParB-like chromosome segregation protein Spo0J